MFSANGLFDQVDHSAAHEYTTKTEKDVDESCRYETRSLVLIPIQHCRDNLSHTNVQIAVVD